MESVPPAQETWPTMAKNVFATLASPRSESDANNHASQINWLMKTEFATHAQSTKSSPTENVPAEPTTSEMPVLEDANFHVEPINLPTKEDAPNAHWTFNTDLKSVDVPALMDSISTTTEFVKRSSWPQSHAMLDFSLTAARDALPVQLAARPVQAPLSVLHVSKMASQSSEEPVKLNAVMDLSPEPNNAMIRTPPETMVAQLPAPSNLCGPALANHQSVPTTVQLFAETEELRREKNAMMETLSMETAAQTDAKKKLQLHQTVETLSQPQRDWA